MSSSHLLDSDNRGSGYNAMRLLAIDFQRLEGSLFWLSSSLFLCWEKDSWVLHVS